MSSKPANHHQIIIRYFWKLITALRRLNLVYRQKTKERFKATGRHFQQLDVVRRLKRWRLRCHGGLSVLALGLQPHPPFSVLPWN